MFIVSAFLLLSQQALAAPLVAAVNGSLSNNSTITISGSGFGSHSLQIESTAANIEAGATGALFAKSGWLNNGSWSPAKYSSDFFHSGGKSLKVIVDPSNNWNGLFTHRLANPIKALDTFYMSYWVRYVGPGANTQWKMFRLSETDTIVDSGSEPGQPSEMVFFNWQPSSSSGPQLVLDPGASNDQTFYPPANVYPSQGGTWFRQEIKVNASAIGISNGTTTVNRYGGGMLNTYTTPAHKTFLSGSDNYSFVEFQNYFGNGATGSPTVWLDDIYISNTPARVEICNSPVWASRTHCEVQIPTAWNDSAINISVQVGSLPSGNTGYLYVIDSANSVNSNGYALTIDGGTTIPRPKAPTNLRVF